jgi:hypothetical protein
MMVEIIEDRALPNGRRHVVLGGLGLIFGNDGTGLITDARTQLTGWRFAPHLSTSRPMLYGHEDGAVKGVIGIITDEWLTSEGVRVRGVLDWSHSQAPRIYDEARRGLLGWSRGAPDGEHVKLEKRADGTRYLKALAIKEWSVTMLPADWRQLPHRFGQPDQLDAAAMKAGARPSAPIKVYTASHNPCEVGDW